ncbi:MAG: hypothetical protein AAFX79_09950 [Planctomycetota bacterium]
MTGDGPGSHGGQPEREPTDRDRARSLNLRSEDVVKFRIVIATALRLVGIVAMVYYGIGAGLQAWSLIGTTRVGWWSFYFLREATLMTLGVVLLFVAAPLARVLVPTRLREATCPDCGHSITELADGRCTECGYLLSPLRVSPMTPLERTLWLLAAVTACYRVAAVCFVAYAILETGWLLVGSMYFPSRIFENYGYDPDAAVLAVGWGTLKIVAGLVFLTLAPALARRTVPVVSSASP